MGWLIALVLLQGAALVAVGLRVRHLDHALCGQGLEIGALLERAGVTDDDIDDYHARMHPECAAPHGGGA